MEIAITIVVLILFSLIAPIIAYRNFLKSKIQNKKIYIFPIVIIIVSISVLLFVPMLLWEQKILFLKKIFENYNNYSEFIIALLGIHSIIQYFISKSNYESLVKTGPHKLATDNNSGNNKVLCVNFKIVQKPENSKYNFALDGKNQLLLVYDVLHSGTGDNLWFPMNEWYSRNQPINKFKQMPLWNYLSFDENKQEEWVHQLNKFIEYLKNTDQIEKDEKIIEQLVGK